MLRSLLIVGAAALGSVLVAAVVSNRRSSLAIQHEDSAFDAPTSNVTATSNGADTDTDSSLHNS